MRAAEAIGAKRVTPCRVAVRLAVRDLGGGRRPPSPLLEGLGVRPPPRRGRNGHSRRPQSARPDVARHARRTVEPRLCPVFAQTRRRDVPPVGDLSLGRSYRLTRCLKLAKTFS